MVLLASENMILKSLVFRRFLYSDIQYSYTHLTLIMCLEVDFTIWILTTLNISSNLDILTISTLFCYPKIIITKLVVTKTCFNFRQTAQHWASAYAGAANPNPDFDKKLKSLEDMGVHRESARVALSSCSWDMNRATDQLFN